MPASDPIRFSRLQYSDPVRKIICSDAVEISGVIQRHLQGAYSEQIKIRMLEKQNVLRRAHLENKKFFADVS